MKFSEKWLREWVDPPVSTEALAEALTMAGLEVDALEPVAGELGQVVVAEVQDVQPHPGAERLQVCRVNAGRQTPLRVVCGASNVRPGVRAPLALPGTVLPGGVEVRVTDLRGVRSEGMLCSASELGLGEHSEGLLELPTGLEPGVDLREALDLDDVSIELGLTPNRSDCLSVAGIAREVGALYECDVEGPTIGAVFATVSETFDVRLEAPEDCPRYVGRVIAGIRPDARTPLWMQERLRRSGLRSLGPVVDVTNYVLLELGQPLHAFDLNRLEGGIRVRRAADGERLTLLDGSTVDLDEETLVIADERRPVALAGIMGGQDSAVDGQTTGIFLESAFFAPRTIAGRARRFGLHTDSSHRFERGVDPELQSRAVDRATILLLEIVGGEAGPVTEVVSEAHLPTRAPVRLRSERLGRLLGTDVPEDVPGMLGRLGMTVHPAGEGAWEVTPPSYRFDIALEVDLIEEVARLHGYDRLPARRPRGELVMGQAPESRVPMERVRTFLVDRGYQEAVTYSFVDPVLQERLVPTEGPIALANPLSTEMSVLRISLWSGLLQAARHNFHRQQERVRLFECGLRYMLKGNNIQEESMISGLAAGSVYPEQWGEQEREIDFYDVKADVEALMGIGGPNPGVRFAAETHPALHPGQCAGVYCGERRAGWIGALHPEIEAELDLPVRVILFELQSEAVQAGRVPEFETVSKFPAVRRDIAIVVDEAVTSAQIRDCVSAAAGASLRDVLAFDVYRGKGVDSGRKSLALGLTLQASSRTLTDADVDAVMDRVLKRLGEEFGAKLRD